MSKNAWLLVPLIICVAYSALRATQIWREDRDISNKISSMEEEMKDFQQWLDQYEAYEELKFKSFGLSSGLGIRFTLMDLSDAMSNFWTGGGEMAVASVSHLGSDVFLQIEARQMDERDQASLDFSLRDRIRYLEFFHPEYRFRQKKSREGDITVYQIYRNKR